MNKKIQEIRRRLSMYGWSVEQNPDGVVINTSRKPIKISNNMLNTESTESCIRYCKAVFTMKEK